MHRWRSAGRRPRVRQTRGLGVENLGGDASVACRAVQAGTTARSRGATWIWTTGRLGLSQTLAWLGLQRPQVREGVDACGVAAFEGDLEGVLTDQHDVFDAQLFGRERLDPRQSPRCACLTTTFSARTCPA